MVKCVECGFLAVRNLTSRALEETEETYRRQGTIPRSPAHPGFDRLEKLPLCFVGSCDLRHEIESVNGEIGEAIVGVLQKDRQCESFTKWQLGFTPKEHRDMMDRQWQLEQEEKRRNSDRKWHWIELGILIIGAGLFTLLGAWITSTAQ